MRNFGLVVYALLLMIFRAFVFTKLWLWFVVPFFGLEKIPLIVALGLMILIRLVNPDELKDVEISTKEIVYAGLFPTISLLFGWMAYVYYESFYLN